MTFDPNQPQQPYPGQSPYPPPQPPYQGQPGYPPPGYPTPPAYVPPQPPKKKRHTGLIVTGIILGAIVIIAIIATAASGGKKSDASKTTTTAAQAATPAATKPATTSAAPKSSASSVDKGAGSKDASADVTIGALDTSNQFAASVPVTITNHSSKRSSYFIELALESADGKTQLDTTPIIVNDLNPGQTSPQTGTFFATANPPAGAKVVLKSVQRLAT